MAVTSTVADVSIDHVWSVLADPYSYAKWVMGAKEVRGATPNWPEVGAVLHHSVGVGPANIKDSTTVLEVTPRERLKLRGRVRPIGTADITIELAPEGSGTRIVMIERIVGGPVQIVYGRLLDMTMRGRNAETLRRLENLAKERAQA